jgi:2-hydroxy-3-keto-5-methylthiopentenyl-1-phosphate phosphatase
LRCSGFGHDKSLTIRPYAKLPADKRPTMFYAGDGVSDLSAARETDLLFAKKGHGKICTLSSERGEHRQ